MRFIRLFLISAAALMISGAAWGDSISSIVVYGDSLSDNGNLFAATGKPGAPYYMGRQSNGPVAVEQMAATLGVPLYDYAYIGATTGIGNYEDAPVKGTPTSFGSAHLPGMLTELADTPNAVSAHPGALFIVWGGPDDFLSPSPLDHGDVALIAQRAITDLLTIVDTLRGEGATDILVPGMPDLGLTPYFRSLGPTEAAEASLLTASFDAALQAELPAGVKYVDTSALLHAVVADPKAYGFTDVTDPCYNGVTVCANPSQYLFFDDFHPTTQADAFVAQEFLAAIAVPEPATTFFAAAGIAAILLFRRVRLLYRS